MCRLNQLVILMTITLLSWPGVAITHDASQHGFRLVSFERSVTAPEFSLKNLGGETVKLEQFRGQTIVLNFWATWCPPCIKEMPSMQRLQQHFSGNQFQVVAISLDKESEQIVQSFASKLNLTFPILLDPEGVAADPYGAKDLPSTFILDQKGQVIAAAKGERDWYSPSAISYISELLGY